jgi:hypothetical protein
MPAGPGVIMLRLMSPGTFMGLGVPGARPVPLLQSREYQWRGHARQYVDHLVQIAACRVFVLHPFEFTNEYIDAALGLHIVEGGCDSSSFFPIFAAGQQ